MSSELKLTLTGKDLTLAKLERHIQYGGELCVSEAAQAAIMAAEQVVKRVVATEKKTYGVNTGFGSLKDCIINAEDTAELQQNLLKSHACGVGPAIELDMARRMFVLRLNTLACGHSGIRWQTVAYLLKCYNLGLVCRVPSQGSVGASGDLAPLSHLFVGYLGEGMMYNPKRQSYRPAAEVLSDWNIAPLELGAKEGLSLNNGTPFMAAHLAAALQQATVLLANANLTAAATLEALHGTHAAFDADIHAARGHPGQILIAAIMRVHLQHSASHARHAADKVQDAYSLRCIPQVHGVVTEVIEACRICLEREMNAATDNPLIFGEKIVSGGNFHGQYLAQRADELAIALTTLGNISERRTERLVNSQLSGLPSFLIDAASQPGLHSGFMIPQYVAAALCAENRTLATPCSVQSISTCAAAEDHVSMGAYATRRLITITDNLRRILAIELMAAVQACEFTPEPKARNVESVIAMVRAVTPRMVRDRYLAPDIDAVTALMRQDLYQHLPHPVSA